MKKKTAKKAMLIIYILLTLGVIPLAYYGLFQHENNPILFWIFIAYCFFLDVWYAKIGEEILFTWEWDIMRKRKADNPEYEY